MAGRNFLFIPGPTNVPDRVQRAMVGAMADHRSSSFPELTRAVLAGLKKVFKTEKGTPIVFAATGTGGWEAALTNTLSPGELVLAARFGQFGHNWIEMTKRLGFEVEAIDCDWGDSLPVERYLEILERDTGHRIKAVLATHNETSTGVVSDIAAVRHALDAARHPALLLVDAVSSLASIDLRMDEWGIDVCVAASQKGLMLPAGLGIVCASEKALAACERSTQPRYFFDFGSMVRANATGFFPYTPALPLLHGLRESLAMIQEEGLENVFHRHHYLASGVRAAILNGWRLGLCAKAPKSYSDTVTAIVVPEGIDSAHVIDVAFRRYNLSLGTGLMKVAGKVFRIAHIGDLNELMLIGALGGAEMAMLDIGIRIEPGSGVAAAQNYWRGEDAVAAKQRAREEAYVSRFADNREVRH
ncbi:MAG: aminotransferase class V-fold PLP-dependent enzyme [Betaproteobacteria bacterium]